MARLSRTQTQQVNRQKVLAAARAEFSERGFREAKIDAIAERAELTRGAVYSNFPGKRALYFAVLAELAEHTKTPARPKRGSGKAEALGAFARAWVARLPLVTEEHAQLRRDLLPEILAGEHTRRPFAQLMQLDALLLGLALERLEPPPAPAGAPPARLVRLAQAVLTTLHGASQLAAAAPGFGEPFDLVSACERLAGLELNDYWPPPQIVPQARAANEPWSSPEAVDLVRGDAVRLDGDGVLAVLGLHRLAAAEEAVRAGAEVTAVLVSNDPADLAPLARLNLAELAGCLRQAFPATALPRLRVVFDETGALAAAAGVPAVSDGTEVAVRIAAGRIVSRADGLGACHAVASTGKRTADATSG